MKKICIIFVLGLLTGCSIGGVIIYPIYTPQSCELTLNEIQKPAQLKKYKFGSKTRYFKFDSGEYEVYSREDIEFHDHKFIKGTRIVFDAKGELSGIKSPHYIVFNKVEMDAGDYCIVNKKLKKWKRGMECIKRSVCRQKDLSIAMPKEVAALGYKDSSIYTNNLKYHGGLDKYKKTKTPIYHSVEITERFKIDEFELNSRDIVVLDWELKIYLVNSKNGFKYKGKNFKANIYCVSDGVPVLGDGQKCFSGMTKRYREAHGFVEKSGPGY